MYPSKKFPSYGTFVFNFVKSLKTNDIEVYRNISINKTNSRIKKIILYINYIIKGIFYLSHSNKYDIVYIHFPTYSAIPLLLYPLKNKLKKKKKIVLNFHGDDLFPQSKISNCLYKLTVPIVKEADMIVVPSNYYKEILLSKISIPDNRLFISPSGGINFNNFFPSKKTNTSSALRIGFLSRIDSGKGWDIFIKAMHLLKSRDIEFVASIGGGGSEYNKLLNEIQRLHLNDTIRLTGIVPYESVPKFLRELDIFIFPSTRKGESLGLTAIEALACGIPVIAKNNGAINEFIINGYNGFIYNDSNPNSIVELIIHYTKLTEQEKVILKYNAFESVKKYDSNIISKKLCKALNEI
jgi:glycosyltransferase involved in cell wall biosynthesis